MSLEQELARNTEAMIALTAALTFSRRPSDTPQDAASALKDTPAPKKPAAVAETTPTATTNFPETTSTQATTAGIEYAQVAKAITDTFKVDRAKPVAALAKFGAANGRQLKPEDYAAFLKELAA
jgi:hypothetical protein